MIDLAWRDVAHNRGRFALTALGLGLLLMIVMGMGGIHRGIVADATLLVDAVGADLWVVQRDTRGPFAELSRLRSDTVHRVRTVRGVRGAREFVFHTIQREHRGRPLRMAVVGVAWPEDPGRWLPLVAGRPLARGHREMVADASLGLSLGEEVELARERYVVVGLTRGLTASGGDGLAVLSWQDSLAIQLDRPGEATRLERAARTRRTAGAEIGQTTPEVVAVASGTSGAIPSLPRPEIVAVLVDLAPGQDPQEVRRSLLSWADVSVYTREEQRQLLLRGSVEKVERQIGLFRVLLTLISTVIMALILYTLTLDKLHSIALLKLLGAPNRTISGMVLRQALLLGATAYAIAYAAGQRIFPLFPRRVVLLQADLMALAGIVLAISVLASLAGIAKALGVRAREALA